MRIPKSVAVAAIALLFAGCVKDNVAPEADRSIKFSAEIDGNYTSPTRAYDTTWEENDEIGIYMLPAEGAFSAAHEPNIRYVHTGGGDFEPAPGSRLLFYPAGGSAVDFTAYYPFHGDVHLSAHDHVYPVDVTGQTDPAAIDLMVAEKITNKTSGGIGFTFGHRLAKIVFNVVDDDAEANLDGMTTVLDGLKVTASYDLETGELTPTGEAATITALPVATIAGDNRASASAIVLPTASAVSFEVTFSISDGFETSWRLDRAFEPGNVYTYPFRLKGTELIPVADCTITPWDDKGGANESPEIEIPKDPATGGGRSGETGLENALFPGADFEDWSLAEAAFSAKNAAVTHSATAGNPGGAILLNKTWTGMAVTALEIKIPQGLSSAKSISFDIKGTVSGGFAVLFGKNDVSSATPCFYTGNPTVSATVNPSSSLSWGTVDTGGEWATLTLKVEGLAIEENGYLIAFRCSGSNTHDLAFDNFTVEE